MILHGVIMKILATYKERKGEGVKSIPEEGVEFFLRGGVLVLTRRGLHSLFSTCEFITDVLLTS